MRLNELTSLVRERSARIRTAFFHAMLPAMLVALLAPTASAIPEITVAQSRTLLASGGSFDFGETRADRALQQVFTISNDGDTNLTISAVTVEAPYQITVPPISPVAPGRRTVVRVQLPVGAPAGAVSGALTIMNDDPNEGTFVVTLNADVQAVAPDINVLAGRVSIPDEGTLDLGTVEAGLPNARVLTIQNTGTANLNIGTPTITGQGYRLDVPKVVPIRPGKKLTITVRFTGTARGVHEGTLTIPSNDPDDEDVYTIELRANATPADARLRAFSQGVPVTDGATVNFGSTRSDRPVIRVVTIKNEGRAPLVLGTPEITGDGFSVLTLPRSPLGPGRATKFRLRLDPAMTGASPTGVLTIPTNIEGLEVFTLNLAAAVTVVSPAIVVTGPSGPIDNAGTFDFGETDLNLALSNTFTISNTGSANLVISAVTVGGTGYTLTRPAAMTIAPGRSSNFVVRLFSAAMLSPANGTVSFTTNVPGLPTFSFALSGRVNIIPPTPELEVTETFTGPGGVPVNQLVLQNSVRAYGPIAAGNTVARTYTIRNRGTAPMNLSGFAFANVTGTAFMVTTGGMLPAMLAPNATHTIGISWLPIMQGTTEATVAFTNDDPDDGEGPVFMFRLRGTSLAANLAFSVRYTGFGGITMTRREGAPFQYPFSLGAGPGGGTASNHNTTFDAFALRNEGATPLIVSNINITVGGMPTTLWIPDQQPPPTFPVPTPTPMGAEVRLNVMHFGLTPGQSIALLEIVSDAAALTPWQFEISQWTNNWFTTMGGLSGGIVRAFSDFDIDGSGTTYSPRVYAAGAFTTPAGSPRIASLSAGSWTALSGGGINDGQVNALASFDEDGNGPNQALLFAAGAFSSIGTPAQTSVNNIAKWNGTAWSPVGPIVSNGVAGGTAGEIVRAMAVADLNGASDPQNSLYVAGTFTSAGALSGVQAIARWDGAAWSRLRPTADGVAGGGINALAVFDEDGSGPNPPALFAGGSFTNVGGIMDRANGIARFDGSNWSILGPTMDAGVSGAGARVNAMVVWDSDGADGPVAPVLVVAGSFIEASTVTDANNIAAWTGSVWQRINPGGLATAGDVFALSVFDEDSFHADDADGNRSTQRTMPGRLFAAGSFGLPLFDGSTANNVARWDGTSWTSLGDTNANGTNGTLRALIAFDADGLQTMGAPNTPAKLFLGGQFSQVTELVADPNPDINRAVNNVAVWAAGAP